MAKTKWETSYILRTTLLICNAKLQFIFPTKKKLVAGPNIVSKTSATNYSKWWNTLCWKNSWHKRDKINQQITKYWSCGPKVWHFWLLNRMVLEGKCVLRGGWFPRLDSDTSPSRLGGVAESTPIPSTSRLGEMIESTRRSVRVDSKLQGLQAVENKKRRRFIRIDAWTTMKRLSKKKNVNPLNRHRNCCHHHPHQSSRCHHYRQYHR